MSLMIIMLYLITVNPWTIWTSKNSEWSLMLSLWHPSPGSSQTSSTKTTYNFKLLVTNHFLVTRMSSPQGEVDEVLVTRREPVNVKDLDRNTLYRTLDHEIV